MSEFKPGFIDLQRDIEGYLVSIGKREKTKDGTIVFRGYDDALKKMFNWYRKEGALAPLVKHLRSWNWEYGYNEFLTELTSSLKGTADWSNLQLLWEKGVLRSRKKLYNDMWKIEKDAAGTLTAKSFAGATERLLETLRDLTVLALEYGAADDVEKYRKLIHKVENGRKA
ncbi:MAG TPA: hypothetical protein VEG60_28295 [Candidatus Binatia bacterium]|nr:hypothetical protein [Candidatus Binatia bacterium]